MTKEQILQIQPKNEIKFTQNWNGKLRCEYYTTIRLHHPQRNPGMLYWVWLTKCDAPDHRAKLISKKTFLLKDLPDMTSYLDTGYSADETKEILKKMYPGKDWNTQQLDILLFQNLEFHLWK